MKSDRPEAWSLLVDEAPAIGSWNMAVDEFLFSSLPDTPFTVVRFYDWERPTASLGCSQEFARFVDAVFCRSRGIDIVRRITGGKLVLHHREVTYAVCSSDAAAFTDTLAESYRRISQALIQGLAFIGLEASLAGDPPSSYARGAEPCFSYAGRNEVECGGKKIIGSAQKRVGARFLQHGSIPLETDKGLLKGASRLATDPAGLRLTSLSELLGHPVEWGRAVEKLSAGFEAAFGVRLLPRALTGDEREAIRRIQVSRYENPDWTERRSHVARVAFSPSR